MRIFVAADYFLPGYKAGGAIQSLANFSRCFGDQHELFFFTRDRDSRDTESYAAIRPNAWNERCGAMVYYTAPGEINSRLLCKLMGEVQPDCVYLNSLFSPISRCFALSKSLRRIASTMRVVMAVRGELNPAALALRPFRKRLYLEYLRRSGAYRSMRFQASSDCELLAIRRHFPDADVSVACDIPSEAPKAISASADVWKDPCRFAYAARISPMKNLAFLLKQLADLQDEAFHLDIFGPISDTKYWARCEPLMGPLAGKVTMHGAYRPDEIWDILARTRFMTLPTLGENFGHSIYESAASGTPYVISDRTPWTDLTTRSTGWALPLEHEAGWKQALRECIHIDRSLYARMSEECRGVAARVRARAIADHGDLFQ